MLTDFLRFLDRSQTRQQAAFLEHLQQISVNQPMDVFWSQLSAIMSENIRDIPFFLLYLRTEPHQIQLMCSSLASNNPAIVTSLSLSDIHDNQTFRTILRVAQTSKPHTLPDWQGDPRLKAHLLPLNLQGQDNPALGVLVFGRAAHYWTLEKNDRLFFEIITQIISLKYLTIMASKAQVYEEATRQQRILQARVDALENMVQVLEASLNAEQQKYESLIRNNLDQTLNTTQGIHGVVHMLQHDLSNLRQTVQSDPLINEDEQDLASTVLKTIQGLKEHLQTMHRCTTEQTHATSVMLHHLKLPHAVPEAVTASSALSTLPKPRSPLLTRALPKKRILIVDDSALNRSIFVKSLEKHFHCITANDGQVAIDQWKQHRFNKPFDAVLMDIEMPIMNGLEATRKIRAIEQREAQRRTPIIGISANILQDQIQAGMDSGMDHYLTKPCTPARLLETVLRYTTNAPFSLKKSLIPRRQSEPC